MTRHRIGNFRFTDVVTKRRLMFHWLSRLLPGRRDDSQYVTLPENCLDPYPTPDTADDWDDASLFAAAGCAAALRYDKHGFENLNDVERSLCCLYLLEAEVNNGGFGQWIYSLCPMSAAESPRVLQRIGATEMATFVADALLPFGEPARCKSKEEWIDNYLSSPDDVHEHLETLTRPFLELEGRFLESAYDYARTHWKDVRTA